MASLTLIRCLLPIVLVVAAAVTVQGGRLLATNKFSDDQFVSISDGVEDYRRVNNQSLFPGLTLDRDLSLLSSSKLKAGCEHKYGFFPCADNVGGYFLEIVVYQYLLHRARIILERESKNLFNIIGTGGCFGGFFASIFSVLKVLPGLALVIVSGVLANKDGAQQQVSVGVGMYAGSTAFCLTVAWGSYVIWGYRNFYRGNTSKSWHEKLSILKDSGIEVDEQTESTAGIMLLSLIPFVIVQLVNVFDTSCGKRAVILLGLIVSALLLVANFVYQGCNKKLQERSLAYLNLVAEDGSPNLDEIRSIFEVFDSDQDNSISKSELRRAIVESLNSGQQKQINPDKVVEFLMKELDGNNNNEIDKKEFVNGMARLVNKKIRYPKFGETRENADSPVDGDDKQGSFKHKQPWESAKSVLQVIIGILMLTFLSGPLMTSIIMLSDAMAIPSFFVSFMIIPIIMNAKMVTSAYFPESKKTKSTASAGSKKTDPTASFAFSEIYNGVTSKNIMGLTTLLAIVYAKDLTWDYSAEVLIILVVCAIIGYLAYSRCFYPLWTCIFAFFLYPFSFALFYLLQKIWGWG